MGGTVGNIFRGSKPNGTALSAGESIGSGFLRNGIGAVGSLGAGLQSQQPGGGPAPAMPAPGPTPTPVDPSYFAPTNFGAGRSAFYGGQ
jgi:hypothetical protein